MRPSEPPRDRRDQPGDPPRDRPGELRPALPERLARAVQRAGVDIDALCALALGEIGATAGRSAHVAALLPGGDDVVVLGQADADPGRPRIDPRATLAVAGTTMARVLAEGRAVATVMERDHVVSADLRRFLEENGQQPRGPVLMAPVRIEGEIVAFLRVAGPPDDPPFTEADRIALQTLADAIAAPVGYRHLSRTLTHNEAAQRALAEMGTRAPYTPSLDDLLEHATAQVCSGADADWAAVFMRAPDASAVRRAATGTEVDPDSPTTIDIAALGDEASADGTVHSWVAGGEGANGFASVVAGTSAVMSVVLHGSEGTYGFLAAGRTTVRRFTASDERFLAAAGHLLTKLTMARSLVDRLRHEASTDDLTGLPNRASLHRQLLVMVERAREDQRPAALLVADLDGFKVVNDSLGHAAGDELLRVVAARLRAHVRPDDLVARLGGDEFAVLCSGVGEDGAVGLGHRILRALREPVDVGGSRIVPRLSIGVAVFDPAVATADQELLPQADLAMYRAKAAGRDRIAVYDVALHDEIQRHLDIDQGLRAALVDDQLFLEYQPIVCLADGTIASFEALVRWHHPTLGLMRPDHFIHVAEESGLVTELDTWALGTAARQMMAWRHAGLLGDGTTVSVNVSARDLVDGEFFDRFRRVLAGVGCPPRWLVAEVTESLLTDEVGAENVRRLGALGVGIALDDYGTGFSSLAQLKRVPVDVVKVDRAFVAGLTTDPVDAAIVASTINLAHALGKGVVAEGVETVEQLEALRSAGCDTAQGYLFARPAPAEAISARLRAGWVWPPGAAAGSAARVVGGEGE